MKTCKDIMTSEVSCCLPDDPVAKVAQIMRDEDVGAVPIVDDLKSKRLQGVVTDRDLVVKILTEGRDPRHTRISEAMTRDVVTCQPDHNIDEALAAMERHQIRRIPIVDSDRRVVGIIAQADVARQTEPVTTAEVVKEISRPTRKAA
jgi:CBS domain-containing protein